jgi:5-enolpyruvylshikimate-3-phosphate synthase
VSQSPVTIDDMEPVATSFPKFNVMFEELGAGSQP